MHSKLTGKAKDVFASLNSIEPLLMGEKGIGQRLRLRSFPEPIATSRCRVLGDTGTKGATQAAIPSDFITVGDSACHSEAACIASVCSANWP